MTSSFRAILALSVALLLCTPLFADESTMKFEVSEWSFGTIEESDGPVEHTFTFTNVGSVPFVIESVVTSCGCTTPDYSRRPIKPNESSEIKVTYDPAGRPGRFSREVVIVSNSRKNKNTITIKGVVKGREKSIEDEYGYEIIGGLRTNSLMGNFSYIEQNQNRSIVIGYANPTDQNMSVTVDKITGAPFFNVVAYPQSLAPGEKGSLTLTYDITDQSVWGYISDSFYVVVDGKTNQIPITTTGYVVEPFSELSATERRNSPEMTIESVYYDFGHISQSGVHKRSFTITNNGKSPLIIRDVKAPQGVSTSVEVDETIAVGASKSFDITVDAAKVSTDYMDSEVTFIVNIPQRPMRKIKLIGYK